MDLIVVVAELVSRTAGFAPALVSAVVVFALSWWVASWVSTTLQTNLEKRRHDPEISLLIQRVARISILSMGTVAALQQVDFDLTAFVAGLGIIGFTIGFALQDVAKNFVAGLLLLLQQPFDIGDAIEVSGESGVVTGINLRATELRTFSGLEVLIPNTQVYVKVVRIFAKELHRRAELKIHAGSPQAENVKTVVLEAICAVPGVVVDQPSPKAMTTAIDEQTSNVVVWFWVDQNRGTVLSVGDAVINAVREALLEASIPPKALAMSTPHADAAGGVG